MFFQSFSFKTVAATAIITGFVVAAPAAHAFSVGDKLQLVGLDDVVFDVNGTNPDFLNFGISSVFDSTGTTGRGTFFVTPSSDGAFAAYKGRNGSIGDLGVIPSSTLPYINFLQVSPDLAFDLNSFDVSLFKGSIFDTLALGVRGVFRNSSGQVLGEGLLTAQIDRNSTSGTSSYSLTATVIPTPALLPGLLALGASVVRKRKAKAMAEAEG